MRGKKPVREAGSDKLIATDIKVRHTLTSYTYTYTDEDRQIDY